jgi:hypothetical protein
MMPKQLELPKQAQRILEVFEKPGIWLKRRDIADKLGKARLNPSETAILDMLAYMQIIEVETRDIPGPIGFEYVYRRA